MPTSSADAPATLVLAHGGTVYISPDLPDVARREGLSAGALGVWITACVRFSRNKFVSSSDVAQEHLDELCERGWMEPHELGYKVLRYNNSPTPDELMAALEGED